ncbi:hypothetical protein ACHCAL_02515 [Providencia huaxiensis]|uniref:hypothetical protein n=3 Tax=Providencia huaxiensis TaxID=2027290 RepID=UPI003756EF53
MIDLYGYLVDMKMYLVDEVRPLFDKSANYLTWSFFSFVACIAAIKAKKERYKAKVKVGLGIKVIYNIYIVLFFCIGVVNLSYIGVAFSVFETKNNSIFFPIVFGMAILIVMLNASTTVHGQIENLNNETTKTIGKKTKYKKKKRR